MKFTLEFKMDNAAFGDGGPESVSEVINILRDVKTDYAGNRRSGKIYDSNGNRIGAWEVDINE